MGLRRSRDAPIGVFDSGVGGLTVLRALREALPREDFLYLGDTARLPYGTKSGDTVARYALQASRLLVERGIKCLVVACNTASAVALPALRATFPALPVLGVVGPGAAAACAATRNGHVAVIATDGTVHGGAYQAAIHALRPDVRVSAVACQVFVALAEEGWTSGAVPMAAARRYLGDAFERADGDAPDTIVLGCTHFPMLVEPIRAVVGGQVAIVDSASTVAQAACRLMQDLEPRKHGSGRLALLATDAPDRFARVGSAFLGEAIGAEQVELVDLNPATRTAGEGSLPR
ncbi:MAG: glutamate racemase [Steroidobacteraceae bacterium]